MSNWPFPTPGRYEAVGAAAAASRGTAVVTGASNTKGSWVELSAATGFDYDALCLTVTSGAGAQRALVDIAVGASGAEKILIPNFYSPHLRTVVGSAVFPVRVAKGSRIAARAQSSSASATNYPLVNGIDFGWPLAGSGLGGVVDMGTLTASTKGTTIDPGGTANTKGAWVELSAGAGDDISAVVLSVSNNANTTRVNAHWLVDIAIGAAGSEKLLVPDLPMFSNAATDSPLPLNYGPFRAIIPASTRLAMRAQCDIIDAADRLFDAILYGIF